MQDEFRRPNLRNATLCHKSGDLLSQVLRLPMSFFDTNPAGRLLNRFSKDTEATDVTLADAITWNFTGASEGHNHALARL